MPSSADIGARLRAIVDAPGVALDAHVVDRFCAELRDAAAGLDDPASFLHLLAMVGYIVDAAVLGDEPEQPMWSAPYQVHRVDWGAASPDGIYRRCWIRDDLAYRVHGRLGNADCLLLELRRSQPQVVLDREDLAAGPDGTFELLLGGAGRPIPPGTVGLSTRELFGDWLGARRSRLRIDCLDGGTAPRPDGNARRVAAAFDLSGEWVRAAAIEYWAERSRDAAVHPNAFAPDFIRTESKLPSVTHAWWDLDEDEALVVELDDPQARFWGVQLATSLWSTLEYANRQTSLNMTQAEPDLDGRYRLVLSHRDPGLPNWLDTTGLRCGIAILRLYRAEHPQVPTTRVVPVDAVAGSMTPEERAEQLARRREGVARLVAD